MKKRRKYFLLYMVLGIAVTLLCGCGGEEEQQEAATPTSATVAVITTTAAPTTEALPEKDAEGFFVTDDYVKTKGETVNVWTAASESSPIYIMINDEVVLHRTGYDGKWTRINYEDTPFYISSNLVTETEKPADGIVAGETDEMPEDEDTEEDEEEEKEEFVDVTKTRSLPKKIVIDPANQATINVELIPVGPGSEDTKQGASMGNVGSFLGTKEFDLNLAYAQMLKAELESRGYEVVMTRESSDVDVSNQARAELAGASGASAMLRISMNFSENSALRGVMGVCMTRESEYNSYLFDESYAFTSRALQGVLSRTGAINQGIYTTDEMAIINWSTIPVAVIKLGYLSNEGDENALVNEEYQRSVVNGLADGIDKYYN